MGYVQRIEEERKKAKEKVISIQQSEVKLLGKKQFFSSSYVQVLTTSKNIAYLRLDNIWKEVRHMKAGDLQQWILKQPEYSEKSLLKENGKKKTMKELQNMIYDDLKGMHGVLEAGIKSWIERNLVILPSTEQLRVEANQ